MKLLRTLILRPLRHDPLRTALTILAVALGVAVVVAIDLAGDAATGSFRSSLTTLTGKTDLEIRANGGIDEAWIARLDALPFDVHFSPVMEGQVEIGGAGSVPLYGFDLTGAPEDTAILSEALAKRLAAGIGSALKLPIGQYHVGRIVDAGPSEFLAIDIAAFERAFGRYGKLDRIDVTVGSTENFTTVERAIRKLLPPAYLVEKPGVRNEENQRMLRAFRWNLRVLSYISLVVGAFLIYNTISVSVVRRRVEIGILRAVGAGRGAVMALFLTEALLLGLAGAALGVALGRVLASGAVGLIAGTVNALYATSRPTPIALSAPEIWIGILAGALTALLSALAPAREAMNVAPTEAMSRGAREHYVRVRWRRYLAWAGVLTLAAYAASQAAPVNGAPLGGYAATLLAIAAAALASPAIVLAVNRAARLRSERSAGSLLAGCSLAGSLARASVIVAALATAIAMMASVGIMVGSFRETVTLWLDNQIRADLYLTPLPRSAGSFRALPADWPDLLADIPGVAAVDSLHALEFHYRGDRAGLGGSRTQITRRYARLRFLRGENRDAILSSLPHQDRAIVSEPFANKYGIRTGQQIELPLGARDVPLTVAGIYYDYSSSQGFVLMDRSTLLRYLPGQPATNAAVYLQPGADEEAVRRAIEERTRGLGLNIARNRELRRTAIEIFDRTFAITWALEAVAIVVAMLGAANSLLAVVLDRRRELGLLRYLGASAAQVRGMILVEAGILGFLAAALGLALGFALSLVLIFVVNRQSFGWTIQFHPPAGLLSGALVAVWCVTVAAGLYPARVAARLNPIDVIHEE
ncbi:MAG TPA: FtsX-like permease family protein [Bryobacteraceae bacterium]|nr:FtsX-like permease family protein [Bryobacteraceae bacterium]